MLLINPPSRGFDRWGGGHFGASRGQRRHRGVDIACHAGSTVLAALGGTVTKIGYPYNPSDKDKGHLRYVEVTDSAGARCRYFYISPAVNVGEVVGAGEPIGTTQGLLTIYPGITDHFHFEVISKHGEYVHPLEYIGQVSA